MHRTHTFVLVHGSWQGAWSWDRTSALLAARGHRVFSPDLPGHHPTDTDRSAITHDDYVDAVLRTVAMAGPDPVVLAGHSLGARSSARWPTGGRTGWPAWCTTPRSCSGTG